MILLKTITKKLEKVCKNPSTFVYDFDIRFMEKWLRDYPQVFPKFMLERKFEPKAVYTPDGEYRWEIHKI